MRQRQLLRNFVLGSVVLFTSCSGGRQMVSTLKDLQIVTMQLVAALHHDQIRVFLNNGHFLSVGVINSPWNSLPPDQKKTKALEIARVAYQAYPSRSELKSVIVTFGTHETYFGIVNYDNSTDSFAFDVSELTTGPTSAALPVQ